MKNNIKVAVLMSTYNGEKYLHEQIDSILSQDGNFSLDLIIRDDGSTDNTIEILKKYGNRITWYKETNLKPAKSFIKILFDNQGYDYYAFADQDDVWLPNKLAVQIETIKDKDLPCISLCNSFIVDEKLQGNKEHLMYKTTPAVDPYSISCSPGIQGCAMVFNNVLAEILWKHKKPTVILMHDSFLARVCTSCGGEIVFNNTSLFFYRQHTNNVEGVKQGIRNKYLFYFKDIFHQENQGVQEQSRDILDIYDNEMTPDIKLWYKFLAEYKDSFRNRICLMCSRKPKYKDIKWGIFLRLKFLLGNK